MQRPETDDVWRAEMVALIAEAQRIVGPGGRPLRLVLLRLSRKRPEDAVARGRRQD